jgi:hypothetical protein
VTYTRLSSNLDLKGYTDAMRLHRRGQSVTELAVALSLFVVILLVGIHLAEVGIVSIKTHDAQRFAAFELTRKPLRPIAGQGTGSVATAIDDTQSEARERFEDLNALDSVKKGNIVTMAMTRAEGTSLTCQRVAGGFAPTATAARAADIFFDAAASCSAQTSVQPIRMPIHFLERSTGDGAHTVAFHRPNEMTVCGIGFASSGSCRGNVRVLLNDWALLNDETESCGRLACNGPHYRNLVGSLYQGNGSAARAFAQKFAGDPGATASDFEFSYMGVEYDMSDSVADELGNTRWHTGGAGTPSGMVQRTSTGHRCFLGKPGCTP